MRDSPISGWRKGSERFRGDKGFRIWDNTEPMGDWRSGSAGALQAQGRGFKSLLAHHMSLKTEAICFGFFIYQAFLSPSHNREGLSCFLRADPIEAVSARSDAWCIAVRFAPEKLFEFGRILQGRLLKISRILTSSWDCSQTAHRLGPIGIRFETSSEAYGRPA